MNEKDFDTLAQAELFIKELADQDNAVDVAKTDDGKIRVLWIKNKTYVTHDNEVFTDEVWTTIDGTMVVVQDLEPEHARNIVRMMIRQERARQDLLVKIADVFTDLDSDEYATQLHDDEPRVLH